MTATPAQVANDLVLQAQYMGKRDGDVASACRDCAKLIRAYLGGQPVDGRTYYGVMTRLKAQHDRYRNRLDSQIGKSLDRGLEALRTLRAGAGQ